MKDNKKAIEFLSDFDVQGDLIIIDLPTGDEQESLKKSKSGLIVGGKKDEGYFNQFEHTVLAIGRSAQGKGIEIGNKIVIRAKQIDAMMINNIEFGVIGAMMVALVKKK